jgi:putative peptidoglycan binding protein
MPEPRFRVTVPVVDRGPEADDWFDEPDLEERRPDVVPDGTVARADDWLDDEADGSQLRPSWTHSINRRMVTVVVSLVALLIAGLAAAGVFSGGGTSPPLGTSSPTPTTQATTATTTATQAQLPAPTTTLKPGNTGTQVAVLQRALASLGFSAGKADGVYGSATTSALKRFQRSVGLTADGILGPATLRALVTALHGG